MSVSAPAVFFLPVTFELLGQIYANRMDRLRFKKYSVSIAFVKKFSLVRGQSLN